VEPVKKRKNTTVEPAELEIRVRPTELKTTVGLVEKKRGAQRVHRRPPWP